MSYFSKTTYKLQFEMAPEVYRVLFCTWLSHEFQRRKL